MSSWTKEGLRLAGVDVNTFTLHSTRAASTSKASGTLELGTILNLLGGKMQEHLTSSMTSLLRRMDGMRQH